MTSARRSNDMISWILATSNILAVATAKIVPADPANDISWPYHQYQTVDFKPPYLNITRHGESSEGYLFLSPDGKTPVQVGPIIMDTTTGDLVWNGPLEAHGNNFNVYEYQGEQILAWWNGSIFPEPIGRGNGHIYMVDKHYDHIKTVTLPGNFAELEPGVRYPSNIDLHELLITPNGSMLVTANNVTQANLASVGGAVDGWVVDCQVYEIDIATNEILFSWKSLDHLEEIPFTASVYPLGAEGFTGANQSLAWGYFHINAVEPYDGGYIISSRYLCSAIAIDASGAVKWRLSGREGGDFKLVGSDAITGFCYQHDIRVESESQSGVTLRMHDNHNSPIENNTVPSTAKVVHVDFETKEATLVTRLFNHSGPVYATAQGNWQPLHDGNIFVGHGWIPIAEEYSPSGDILTSIQFGAAKPRPEGGFVSFPVTGATIGYRDFKQHWVGCPRTKPDVVAEHSSDNTKVFVSWNGATEVVAWEIYVGDSKGSLERIATVSKRGFETEATIAKAKYIQVKPVLKRGCSCTNTPSSAVVKAS